MKKLLILSFMLIFIFVVNVYSEVLPEFTGNYVLINKEWTQLNAFQFDKMQMDIKTEEGHAIMTYAGFFKIPKEIQKIKIKKPRILLYSGKAQANIETTALVELEKYPYNNQQVFEINGKRFDNRILYNKNDVQNELWIFKREIRLRSKPIDGKVSMFLYEPAEELTDGFYIIESSRPTQTGHSGLISVPTGNDFYKLSAVQGALAFIVGDVKETSAVSTTSSVSEDKSIPVEKNFSNEDAKNTSKNKQNDIVEKAVDSIFQSVLGK